MMDLTKMCSICYCHRCGNERDCNVSSCICYQLVQSEYKEHFSAKKKITLNRWKRRISLQLIVANIIIRTKRNQVNTFANQPR